jgi:hypothetical protein
MIKRQFGKGKAIKASDQNLAQIYTTTNLKDIAIDGNIIGITSSGYLYPDPVNLNTVILISLQARRIDGERIYINTSTGIYMKPSIYVPSGYELYMSAFASYADVKSEIDTDSNNIVYYKDIQNGYSIYTLQGVLAATGLAVKPTIPENSILLCDILYNNSLYLSGLITSSGIDIFRQTRKIHVHSNFNQLELITDGLHDSRTTNPHSVTKTQVGLGNVTNNAQVNATLSGISDGAIPTWSVSTGDGLNGGYIVGSTVIDSTTEIPNSLAIQEYAVTIPDVLNALQYIGDIDCSVNPDYPSSSTGHTYKVSASGKIGGASGISVTTGDFLVCKVDGSSSGDEATVGYNWILLNKEEFVNGLSSSIDNNIVVFDASGKFIFDSGYQAQLATTSQYGLVQLSDSYTGTSSGLAVTEKALSDGLAQWSNVTNDAQLKRAGNDYCTFDDKTTSTGYSDIVLIEDSEDTYTKKFTLWCNLLSSSGNTDTDAFYLSSSGEINALSEKTSSTGYYDIIFIENSEDSYNKNKVSLSSLSISILNPVSEYISSTGDIGELEITATSSGYTTVSINTTIGDWISLPRNYNTWITSGSLNTARYGLAGSGTQNAGLSFGGDTGSVSATTEKFTVIGWSTTGDLNTARYYLAGCGVQNSALSFGGFNVLELSVTEKFNGSTWSTDGGWDLNTARYGLAGCGTQNSGLSFGGNTGSVSAVTEKFNGSTWVATGNLNTARNGLNGFGIQNSALSFGGTTGAVSVVTEKFTGSSWVTTGNLNTARAYLGGAGVQNAGLGFGGTTGAISAVTEKFNGSTWATDAGFNLNTARSGLSGAGMQNSALSFGGYTGSISAVTEKFNEGYKLKLNVTALENTTDNTATQRIDISTYESNCVFNIKIPAIISYGITCEREYDTYSDKAISINAGLNILNYGIWIVTGSLNNNKRLLAGCGTQNSALSFGGYTTTFINTTEKFNGTSWVATGSLNTARNSLAGCGTQNAGLSFSGYTGSVRTEITEKFNGTIWSTDGGWNLNTARRYLAGCGTQNAGLSFGGNDGSVSAVTEKFNGSTWVATGSLNTARSFLAGSGTQNAGLSFGGYTGSNSAVTEKFNGSTWSNSGNLNNNRTILAGCGIQNSALSFGGYVGAYSAITEKFNGIMWISTISLNTARGELAGCGTQNSALSFGGYTGSGSVLAVTEKFNYNADISELFSDELDCYVDKSNVKIYY